MEPFAVKLHTKGDAVSDAIKKHGCWEPVTSEVLMELFKHKNKGESGPRTIFIDIGAGIGYFSLLAARNGIPAVAFEPIAANYALFTQSVIENKFNGMISVNMVPLSDTHDKLSINVYKNLMELSTIHCLPHDLSYVQTIKSKTLDSYFGYQSPNYMIVKIDTNGMEKRVLFGMTNTLLSGKVTHIIIELYDYDPEIFQFLRKHGYIFGVIIGYAGDDKTTAKPNTHHLSNFAYHSDIDSMEKHNVKLIGSHNGGCLSCKTVMMFYKTLLPL